MDIAATARPEIAFLRSVSCAGLMTFGLLYFMHLLIDTGVIDDPRPIGPIAPIIAIPQVIEVIKEDLKPKLVEDPAKPPPVAPREVEQYEAKTEGLFTDFEYKQPTPAQGAGVDFGAGGLVQQVMVPPTYPSRALDRGIEGYVDIQFEVTAMGSTQRVFVLRSEPQGVFDKSAIRAVKRWKYLPDDARTNSETLQERIRFSIEK